MSLHRRGPRSLKLALDGAELHWSPATRLAEIQRCWPRAVGARITAVAVPVAERGGLLTVRCDDSSWSSQLQLMEPELIARVNAELGESVVSKVRCVTA